jgi:hypothetical protein
MHYLVAENSNPDSKSIKWPPGQKRYFRYALGLTCATAEALFKSLTLEQQIAQSTTDIPAGNFVLRDCGGGGTDPVIPPYEDEDYAYQGVEFGGAPSSNTDLLDLVYHYDHDTDEIVIDFDKQTHENDRYFINGRWLVGTINGHRQDPMLPMLVQKFRIDPSRPQDQWWDDPVENAMQTIRFI